MPSLQDSTPDVYPPIAVTPPRVTPSPWRDCPVFREAFLMYLSEEPLNNLLRIFGRALFDVILNTHRWPDWPEGVTATELRAALADLRHLQGYLAGVGEEIQDAPLGRIESSLSRLAARQSEALAKVGDDIERGLDVAARERIEHPEKPDLTDPPPLGELFKMCEPLPWEKQCQGAREWLIARSMRGALNGTGVARLLEELRSRADQGPSFGFFHVLALELLSILREEGGKGALARAGLAALPAHFLGVAGIPAAVAKHYRRRLRCHVHGPRPATRIHACLCSAPPARHELL